MERQKSLHVEEEIKEITMAQQRESTNLELLVLMEKVRTMETEAGENEKLIQQQAEDINRLNYDINNLKE